MTALQEETVNTGGNTGKASAAASAHSGRRLMSMDYFFLLNQQALSLAQIFPGYVLAVQIDQRYCYEVEVGLDSYSKEPYLLLLTAEGEQHSPSSVATHLHTPSSHSTGQRHARARDDEGHKPMKFRCFSDYLQFIAQQEKRVDSLIFTDLCYKSSKEEHLITYRPIHHALASFRKNLAFVNDFGVYTALIGLYTSNASEYTQMYGPFDGAMHVLNDIDYYALKEEEYDFDTCPFSLGTLKDFCYYMKVTIWGNHQKLEYWLKNYLNHCANTRMFTPLPAGEQLTSYFLGEHEKHPCFTSNVQFIHWKWNKDQPLPTHENFSFALNPSDYYFFHHGTSSDDMWDILKSGIDVNRSAPEQDFSHLKGFYCFVDEFQPAFDWAMSKSGFLPAAVMIFAVPKVSMNTWKILSLDPTDGEEWDRVVKGYRLGIYHGEGEDDSEEAKTFNRIEENEYDCLFGPICSNPDLLFHESPRHENDMNHQIRQVCFKSEKAIQFLQQHLVCIYKVAL